MDASGRVRLVVRGDDFGMCHAVNEGISRAFTEGIVTTSSMMAPCPWFGEAVKIYDIAAILNPDTGLANVLANFSDPKADGRETVNGVDAVRITGMVSADAVNKIAPSIKATGPVPGTAWIREDGDHELVQAKLEPSPGNTITMTCSDWGKSVSVTKPTV